MARTTDCSALVATTTFYREAEDDGMPMSCIIFTVLVGAVLLVAVGWCSRGERVRVRTSVGTQTDVVRATVVATPASRTWSDYRIQGRTVQTQSQVTYARHRMTPRFVPLQDRETGAWVP